MDIEQYQPIWDKVAPMMRAKLEALRAALQGQTELQIGEIYEGGDEEFALSFNLNQGDVTVLGVDFRLLDGEVHGDDGGVGVKLDLTGYGGRIFGGYAPGNYSADAFTDDIDEIAARINETPVSELTSHIAQTVLTDARLLQDVAEADS